MKKNKKHHHSNTDALEKIKGDLSAFNNRCSNNTALQVLDFSSLKRSMKMLELPSRQRRGKIHIIHTYTCVCDACRCLLMPMCERTAGRTSVCERNAGGMRNTAACSLQRPNTDGEILRRHTSPPPAVRLRTPALTRPLPPSIIAPPFPSHHPPPTAVDSTPPANWNLPPSVLRPVRHPFISLGPGCRALTSLPAFPFCHLN